MSIQSLQSHVHRLPEVFIIYKCYNRSRGLKMNFFPQRMQGQELRDLMWEALFLLIKLNTKNWVFCNRIWITSVENISTAYQHRPTSFESKNTGKAFSQSKIGRCYLNVISKDFRYSKQVSSTSANGIITIK